MASREEGADFDLHGLVGVRVVDGTPADVAVVRRQLGHPETTVPLLVDRLADPHPLVAHHLRFVVREIGDGAIAPLLRCYEARPADRPAIASVLGFLGPRARGAAELLRRDAGAEAIAAATRDEILAEQGFDANDDETRIELVRKRAEGN